MQGDIAHITLLVTRTLDQLGIAYAVGGSLASSLHGVMRATLDVDIVADMKSSSQLLQNNLSTLLAPKTPSSPS